MNWQISKIEISSFKAFKHIYLDLGSSSLLTLDGPNGYGKTSIFDAIELLLTGEIKRIQELFLTLLTKNKKDYADNLFWNKRSGENDLYIKIEFSNEDRKLTLARHCPAKIFKKQSNNRADKYEHFKLYELPEFESLDFTPPNARENQYLEEVFGKHFRENFSFLNYLEQGQNRLLHTRVDDRKKQLGNLFNISEIETEIDNCSTISTKLTKFINNSDRIARAESLKEEVQNLRGALQNDAGAIEYKRLSTTDVQTGWDNEVLFVTYSITDHSTYQESVRKIKDLLPLKSTIRTRAFNDSIDAFIIRNEDSLKKLAEFGNDLDKLDELDAIKKEIETQESLSAIIKRGALEIKSDDARKMTNWSEGRLEWFEAQILARDSLQKQSTSNASIIAELDHLKKLLIDQHKKINSDDKLCPLCGADWEDHQSMVEAVDRRTNEISASLSQDGLTLRNLIAAMDDELARLNTFIQDRLNTLTPIFNRTLHEALTNCSGQLIPDTTLRFFSY